uniref:ATP-binding protein n=1 Tax=uncultured Cohaesibacter sp. TaxID=1002546 RepID=UPI00292CE4B2
MPERQPDALLWTAISIQDKVSDTLSRILSGDVRAAVITGPPGCGKTWLARSIGASFVAAGGVAFRGVGDDGEANRRLYPLQRAQAETSGYFKPAVTVGKALANVAAKVASGGMLDAEGAIQAFDAEAARRKRGCMFLAEDEQSVLSDLAVHAGGRPALLIVENLHWWDRDSLSLLRTMLKREVSTAFPFLEQLRVVATTTNSDYQQPIWRDAYSKHVMPLFPVEIEMGYVKRSQLRTLRQVLAIPETIKDEDFEFVHGISGGHLTVIGEACHYLSECGISVKEFALEDRVRFVEDLFLQRLRSIGTLGDVAKQLLHAASIIGTTASRVELFCVYRHNGSNPEQAIQLCRDFGFLEDRGEFVEFRHQYIKEFFAKDLGLEEMTLRRIFSECLRQLTPHDYQRRALNLLKSGDRKGAADLLVAAVAENLRFGRPPHHLMHYEEKELVLEEGLGPLADCLQEAYLLLSK